MGLSRSKRCIDLVELERLESPPPPSAKDDDDGQEQDNDNDEEVNYFQFYEDDDEDEVIKDTDGPIEPSPPSLYDPIEPSLPIQVPSKRQNDKQPYYRYRHQEPTIFPTLSVR